MTLPYSDAIFCCVFPKESTETFQEGHVRAFEFFGGVPTRITYDNSGIAVSSIEHQRGAVGGRNAQTHISSPPPFRPSVALRCRRLASLSR